MALYSRNLSSSQEKEVEGEKEENNIICGIRLANNINSTKLLNANYMLIQSLQKSCDADTTTIPIFRKLLCSFVNSEADIHIQPSAPLIT